MRKQTKLKPAFLLCPLCRKRSKYEHTWKKVRRYKCPQHGFFAAGSKYPDLFGTYIDSDYHEVLDVYQNKLEFNSYKATILIRVQSEEDPSLSTMAAWLSLDDFDKLIDQLRSARKRLLAEHKATLQLLARKDSDSKKDRKFTRALYARFNKDVLP